jgi:peptidylprolyl isomerase
MRIAFVLLLVAKGSMAAPTFMVGEWCAGNVEERWTAPAQGLMLGQSRTMNGRSFEFLRIVESDGDLRYLAQPGGRAPTEFRASERSAEHVVFENASHDWPKRIEYRLTDMGLRATVSAGEDDPQTQTLNFHKGPCLPEISAATPELKTMADVLNASTEVHWRQIDPESALYLQLPQGRVVIELAERFAPQHVANIKALVREGYFDGLAVVRVQDNFVAQWGDPDAGDEKRRRPIKTAKRTLPAEFTRASTADLPFHPLSDGDGFAPEVGFSEGFPTARGGGRSWLAHCYGAVGAGRDNGVETGGGTELYVVIGHAPRQLDRNITVVGRVVYGMEHLAALPRGPAPMGFYDKAEHRVPIRSVRVAADVAAAERLSLEIFRTDTPLFDALIEARRNRRDDWYKVPAGNIDLCNVPIPVRIGEKAP